MDLAASLSSSAVESTPSAQAQGPPIIDLSSPTSVTVESIRDETIRRIGHRAS